MRIAPLIGVVAALALAGPTLARAQSVSGMPAARNSPWTYAANCGTWPPLTLVLKPMARR